MTHALKFLLFLVMAVVLTALAVIVIPLLPLIGAWWMVYGDDGQTDVGPSE